MMTIKKILGLVFVSILVLPMLAGAQIYKWKDKNGVMRYSDTPPPVTVKADTFGKSGKAKPRSVPTPSESVEATKPGERVKEVAEQNRSEEAARIRARNAEIDKERKLEKERTAQLNKENCKLAKANYQTFAEGGRIYKKNEKGERIYYGDSELKAAKAKAQREIRKFCN